MLQSGNQSGYWTSLSVPNFGNLNLNQLYKETVLRVSIIN